MCFFTPSPKTTDGTLRPLRNYKFGSLLIRYFLIFSLLILLPLLLISTIYSQISRNIIQEEIYESNQTSLDQSAQIFDMVIDQMYSCAYHLSSDHNANWLSFFMDDTAQNASHAAELWKYAEYYTATLDYIDSVYIYFPNQKFVINNGNLTAPSRMLDKSWFPFYSEVTAEKYILRTRKKRDSYPDLLTMLYPITAGTDNVYGVVVVNADIHNLGQFLWESSDAPHNFFVLDDELHVHYTNRQEFLYPDEENPLPGYLRKYLLEIAGSENQFPKHVYENGEEILLTGVRSATNRWWYILSRPLSYPNARLDATNDLIYTIMTVALLLGLGISIYLSQKAYAPIRRIIKEIPQPNTNVENYLLESSKDELQYITSLVRHTQSQNSNLQLEVSTYMNMLNTAQLRMLQFQINPHFLYNTLDAINWNAVELLGFKNNVSEMLSALAQLLRISLQRSSYLVTLSEEMEHAKLYTRILEIRFPEKIQVHWDIDPALLDRKVLKLCLQPLIENSIEHGLRPRRYQGNIFISAELTEENLILSVADDGIGMEEEVLRKINDQLNSEYLEDDTHLGLRNVNQRIKILFGEQYGILLKTEVSGGLAVCLILPA